MIIVPQRHRHTDRRTDHFTRAILCLVWHGKHHNRRNQYNVSLKNFA